MADNADILKYQVETGDSAAKLDALAQKIKATDAAFQSGATGIDKSGVSGGHVFEDFDRKGEKLVKTVLGGINPSLASTVDVLFDINDGLSKVTGGMLALTAAGVGISAIQMIWRTVSDEIAKAEQRAREVEDRMRQAQQRRDSVKTETLDRMRDAGVVSAAAEPGVSRRIEELMGGQSPMERGLAREVAIAEAAGFISTEQARQLAAGLFAAGEKQIDFKAGGGRQAIARLLQLGANEKSQTALAQDQAARSSQISADRLPASTVGFEEYERRAIDQYVQKLKENDPNFTQAREDLIRKVVRDRPSRERLDSVLPVLPGSMAEFFGELYDDMTSGHDTKGDPKAGLANMRRRLARNDAEQVLTELGQIRSRFAEEQSQPPPAPVTNYIIGTQLNGAGNAYLNPGFSSQMAGPTPSFGGR